MRRRRIFILLALVLIAVGAITWRMTHRHDPRFVGKWLLTRGTKPTAEELKWTPNQSRLGDRIEWTFDADGTGRQFTEQEVADTILSGISVFTWSTDGESVSLTWDAPQEGWAAVKVMMNKLFRLFRGDSSGRPPDVYAYSVADETSGDTRQFVMEFQTAARVRTDDVYYLTRIDKPMK